VAVITGAASRISQLSTRMTAQLFQRALR